MTDQNSSQKPSIREDQVVQFLIDNPDFFVQHPNLLADISLPHESGKAISLVERQVSVLRERNMDMRHRLSSLLDNARDNDRLFDKTKRLVLALLESNRPDDIIDALFYSFDKDFQIHYTSLILFTDTTLANNSPARTSRINDAREHIGAILRNNKPVCGALSPEITQYLFPEHAESVASLALTPLVHGSTYGVLAVGNRDPKYYRTSMGTLFLSYIGEVLNRLLPQQLDR